MTITVSAESTRLIAGYQLCAATEGKSPNSIAIVVMSVRCFQRFLSTQPGGTPLTDITHHEIRAFIFHLQHAKCYSVHPTIPVQNKGLSGHTVNCYLRSLRVFYSWLVAEEIIPLNPFAKVKIPPAPRKVIPAFSNSQIDRLLKAIHTTTAVGYRDYALILSLLDTALRVSELCNLKMENLSLEEGVVKVLGKGNKERIVPMGKQVQRVIWHYIECCRPEPATANCDSVFLTRAGRPLNIERVQHAMTYYGQKAGLTGIRCSPHTLRHTAAIAFLRNGGDVFSLQRLLGHSSLEMTRRYCEVTDVDVKRAHVMASPVDNLDFALGGVGSRLTSLNSRAHARGDEAGSRGQRPPSLWRT